MLFLCKENTQLYHSQRQLGAGFFFFLYISIVMFLEPTVSITQVPNSYVQNMDQEQELSI